MTVAPQGQPFDGLASALALARLGLYVFPLQAKSKAPQRGAEWAAWQDYATTDEHAIRRLWMRAGIDANVGVLMGTTILDAAGRAWVLVGLDVDEREQFRGSDSLAALEAELGPLPSTPRVASGSANGSVHLYLLAPAGVELRNIKLDPQGGVQLKAHHGYLVGPGSIHPDTGQPYLWEYGYEYGVDLWPGTFPERWLSFLRARMAPVVAAHEPVEAGRLQHPGDHLPDWPELLKAHGATYAGTKFVDGAPCQAWLRPAGTNPPTSDHSAVVLDAGLWVYTDAWPTKVPGRTLPTSEDKGGHTYSRIGFEAAMRYGADTEAAISRTASELRTELGLERPLSLLDASMRSDTLLNRPTPPIDVESREVPNDDATPETPTTLLERVLWGQAIGRLPKPEPLIEGFLDLNTVSLVYGPYGKGKSLLALDWALHVATGRPWGERAVRQGRVVYLVAEGAPGMHDRLRAWCDLHLGHPDAEVPDLAWIPYPAQLIEQAIVTQFREVILELRPVLVIIDTVARTAVGLDENSAKEMGAYVHALDLLRLAGSEAGVPLCALPVHHAGKENGRGARGNTALPAATSGLFEVTGIEGDDRLVKLRTERQKDRAPAGEEWFRITNMEHGSVVLQPTEAPDAEGAAGAPAPDYIRQANALRHLDALDDGRGVPSGTWEGDLLEGRVVGSHSTFVRLRKTLVELRYVTAVERGTSVRNRVSTAGRVFLEAMLDRGQP
jgi:hypothetical protein